MAIIFQQISLTHSKKYAHLRSLQVWDDSHLVSVKTATWNDSHLVVSDFVIVSICAIERGFVSWCTTVPPVSKLKAMGNWQIWYWSSGACVYHFKMKLFMVLFYDISFLREVGFIKIRALFEQNVRNFHSHGFIIAKCIFSLNWIITNLTPSLYSANRDHNKITILRDENHLSD